MRISPKIDSLRNALHIVSCGSSCNLTPRSNEKFTPSFLLIMNPWVHLHGHLPKIYGRYIWVPSGINHIIRWCDIPLAFCILATHIKKRKAINHSSEKQKKAMSQETQRRCINVVATLNSDVGMTSRYNRSGNVGTTSKHDFVPTSHRDVEATLYQHQNNRKWRW